MARPRLLILSLGGTITMVKDATGAMAPGLGAEELVQSIPQLDELAELDARSLLRLPSPSISLENILEVAQVIEKGFAEEGFDGAVVIQGTDTIEESAFLLDLLVGGDRPVVVTGAMRGAEAPGADGPANLLAATRLAVSQQARGLGALVVLNYDIHAARFVQKSHTAVPSAFTSPLVGPLGVVAEGRPRLYARVERSPVFPTDRGSPAPIALLKMAMGYDARILKALPDTLGYAGLVVEGMGAGHVPAEVAPILGEVAKKIPVVLASRSMTGPVFTSTYGYPGSEIDLISRGLIPAGYLSGLKARLLLGLCLRQGGDAAQAKAAFAQYQ
ncbi:MAG: asparaginase [Phycisphaeraceae bacterium]|nr:MAG: asparaginase [Phycisphaeraceae bacterium]